MNTANRVLWLVIGAVLALAGILGILANRGWLPGADRTATLFASGAGATWRRYGAWAPALVIAAGVVLVVLGALLLRAELRAHRTRAMKDLTLYPTGDDQPGPTGRTRVDTAVLARAMRQDLQSDPRISSAHVRITGHPDRPEVFLRLEIDQLADLRPVRDRVTHSLDRLAATMPGHPTIHEVLINSSRRAPARVR